MPVKSSLWPICGRQTMKPGTAATRKVVADKKTMTGKTMVATGPTQGVGDVVFGKRITNVPTCLCPPSSAMSNGVKFRLTRPWRWESWYARMRALKGKKLPLFTSHANMIYCYLHRLLLWLSLAPPFFVLHWTGVYFCSSLETLPYKRDLLLSSLSFTLTPPRLLFFLFSTRLQRVFALVLRPFYFPC